jgi:hypothetical protein
LLNGKFMSENNMPNPANRPRLRSALDKVRRELDALNREDLVPINFDPIAAVVTARGAYPNIAKYRGLILTLQGFQSEHFEQFETYVQAAYCAQTLLQAASAPPEQLQELIAEATELRESLLSDATALAKRGLISAVTLDTLKGNTSYKTVASDLMTLTHLFRGVWAKIVGKTCVTEEELDRAEVLSDEVIYDLGQREQVPSKIADVSLERQKAYTLFLTAYNQLRRAITYIRWNEGDADEIAPSLFGGRKRKVGSKEDSSPDATAPITQVSSTSTIAHQLAAVPTEKTEPIAVGLPGANPFTN